jgi:hypothetical protein
MTPASGFPLGKSGSGGTTGSVPVGEVTGGELVVVVELVVVEVLETSVVEVTGGLLPEDQLPRSQNPTGSTNKITTRTSPSLRLVGALRRPCFIEAIRSGAELEVDRPSHAIGCTPPRKLSSPL